MPDAIPVPPEAVTASVRALQAHGWPDGETTEAQAAQIVLAAAVPLIAAAERRRIGEASFSPDEDDRTGLFRLARADGALTERQRICQLADRAEALYPDPAAPGWRSLDPRAVFLGMARACEPVESAAQELARQGWLDDADENDQARWAAALAGLRDAAAMFKEIADGWI